MEKSLFFFSLSSINDESNSEDIVLMKELIVENLSRESDHAEPMEQSALIYLASVLEYLVSDFGEAFGLFVD